MGPPQADEALKNGHCPWRGRKFSDNDRAFAGSTPGQLLHGRQRHTDPWSGAPHYCGKQAIDGDTAQVGPGIAEMLNIPLWPGPKG